MVLGCDVGKIEHANGRAIEGASSKVHGELTRLQVSSNLRHTCLVAASRKIERKNRTTTAKVHEGTRLECLHEHKMKSLCQPGQCTNLHQSQQTDTFAVYGIHRTKIHVTAAVMVPLTIIPRPVIETLTEGKTAKI